MKNNTVLKTAHTTKNYKVIVVDFSRYIRYMLFSYDRNIAIIDIYIDNTVDIIATDYYNYSAATAKHINWFYNDVLGEYVPIPTLRVKAAKQHEKNTITGYYNPADIGYINGWHCYLDKYHKTELINFTLTRQI